MLNGMTPEEIAQTDIQRHMVRHKYLSEEELGYQFNAIHGV